MTSIAVLTDMLFYIILLLIMSEPPTRSAQLITPGLGKHFTSPQKRRAKPKDRQKVQRPGTEKRIQNIHTEMQKLLAHHSNPVSATACDGPSEMDTIDDDSAWLDEGFDVPPDVFQGLASSGSLLLDTTSLPKPILPDRSSPPDPSESPPSKQINSTWHNLIPTLEAPLLDYVNHTRGRSVPTAVEWSSACPQPGICVAKEATVLCLFWDRKYLPDYLKLLQPNSHHRSYDICDPLL